METNRQLQEELDALTRLVESPKSLGDGGLSSPPERQDDLLNEPNGRDIPTEPASLDSTSSGSLSRESTDASGTKRRRFGIFPAIVALTIGGNVAAGLLG